MDDATVVDWLLDQSTKAYESEREFTAKLRDRAGFILGFLITPIGGAITSLLATFKGDIFEIYNFIFFTTPLFAASLLMILSLWKILQFLRKSIFYKAPLTPKQLFDYYNEGTDKEESFLHTRQVMAKSLSEAVEESISINSHRLKGLITCQKLAVYSAPLIILCSLKYFHTSYTQQPSAIDVNLINDINQIKRGSNVQSIQLIERHACFESSAKPASAPRPSSSSTGDALCSRSRRHK